MMICGMIGGRPVPHREVVVMPERRAPSVRGRQLAAELRRLRDALRLTGEEVAERLGWSPSKISRIETGTTAPSVADLRQLLDTYEVSGTQRERLELLGQTAGQRGWWDAYADTLNSDYAALIGLEDQAASIRWYAAQIIPGLAQTEVYAREIVRSGSWTYPPGEIERRVQVRMNRQKILTRDQPVTLAVVLDEAVLHHQVGGPQLMRAQLRHLAELSGLPNVEVQVLPDTAGAHAAVHGEFQILGFPELIATDVVYLEHLTSSIYVEREAEVFRYSLAFDQLRALALSADDSRALIEQQAATLS
jgi:transcriptional regulator with XRE-family HTH domain